MFLGHLQIELRGSGFPFVTNNWVTKIVRFGPSQTRGHDKNVVRFWSASIHIMTIPPHEILYGSLGNKQYPINLCPIISANIEIFVKHFDKISGDVVICAFYLFFRTTVVYIVVDSINRTMAFFTSFDLNLTWKYKGPRFIPLLCFDKTSMLFTTDQRTLTSSIRLFSLMEICNCLIIHITRCERKYRTCDCPPHLSLPLLLCHMNMDSI